MTEIVVPCADMPPMQTGKVEFPEDWRPTFEMCRNGTRLVIGGLSVFDGLPRPTRRISEALRAKGLPTGSMDIRNDTDDPDSENVLEVTGQNMFLEHLAALQKDSLLWLAPPCKSWGFLPRSVSGRSKSKPHGVNTAWVYQGNEQANFVERALLAATCEGWSLLQYLSRSTKDNR